MERVVYISHNRDTILRGKIGKDSSNELRAEMEENLRAKRSALSMEDNTPNWVKREGIEDYDLFSTLLQRSHGSQTCARL